VTSSTHWLVTPIIHRAPGFRLAHLLGRQHDSLHSLRQKWSRHGRPIDAPAPGTADGRLASPKAVGLEAANDGRGAANVVGTFA